MTRRPARSPLWRAIADSLRQTIARGEYPQGHKLPTEAALAARFGVNRHTVRRAIAQLAQEGLVHARRGAGVFVLGKPLEYPLSERVRFHQNLLAEGVLPGKTILSVELRSASPAVAERLQLTPGDAVAVRQTLSFADGTPVALSESAFPEARLPGLAEALRADASITDALAAVGVRDYTRVSTRLSAVLASPTQALHLKTQEGAPLLMAGSLSHDSTGLPIEDGQTWFASERITLTMDHTGGMGRTL